MSGCVLCVFLGLYVSEVVCVSLSALCKSMSVFCVCLGLYVSVVVFYVCLGAVCVSVCCVCVCVFCVCSRPNFIS